MQHVDIYTDGSSRGNPGPGGYGAVLRYTAPNGEIFESELSQGYELTTNNRMELLGAIIAFEALKNPCEVTLYTDSQYLVNAFNQHWIDSWIKKGWKNSKKELVANRDLWERLLVAIKNHSVKFVWVKGHAGHEENERCDTLATMAADSDNLERDEGYIQQSSTNTLL